MNRFNELLNLNAYAVTPVDLSANPDPLDPPFRALVISDPGDVEFVNGEGDTVTYKHPSANVPADAATVPFILWGKVTQIGDNTSVNTDNILGLR